MQLAAGTTHFAQTVLGHFPLKRCQINDLTGFNGLNTRFRQVASADIAIPWRLGGEDLMRMNLRCKVLPGCPFCPPGLLPLGSLSDFGFLKPSVLGGLLEL